MKDEQKIICKTIRKYSKVKYPANKWEIIVIDDGSRDNTLSEIQKAIRDFSHAVKINAFKFTIHATAGGQDIQLKTQVSFRTL